MAAIFPAFRSTPSASADVTFSSSYPTVTPDMLVPRRLAATVTPSRDLALDWAEHQTRCWYAWGGTSCQHGFDCSGLVQMAYRHAGIWIPRTTYEMLRSSKLVRISGSQLRRGDLVFYGSGHVELATRWWHTTFGALESGTRVGWHHWYSGSWWHPTAYYRVR